LWQKRKSLRQINYQSDLKFASVQCQSGSDLANPSAQKLAVALDAHFSAGQQVSHSRDRFFRVPRAGANGEDKIAKGKFRTRLQDLAVFLHCFVSF
jgi:hypothetical protein